MKKKPSTNPTADSEAFKPITVPENPLMHNNENFHVTDAAFLHPGIEHIPLQYNHTERPKSAENSVVIDFIHETTSLSNGNSPIHDPAIPTIINVPGDVPSIHDWNELIKIHEITETAMQSHSEPVTNWLPPLPFTATYFYAYATFVDDNAHIYLHDEKYATILNEMEKRMKTAFDALPPEPKGTIWVPEQICTARYFLTDHWYRGKVLEVTDEHIKVFMIDYGNVEECKSDDLRFKVMYTNIPAFANKVQLYKVFPKSNEKWLTSDLDELHKSVVDKKVLVVLKGEVKPDFITSAVVKVGDISINTMMSQASTNLRSIGNAVKQSVIPDTEDVVIEEDISEDSALPTTENMLLNLLPPSVTFTWKPLSKTLENQRVPVGIVNIIAFNKIIIEFVQDVDEEAKTLFGTIADDIKMKGGQQPFLFDLQIGQACVAQFSEDGEWYRGQVFNLENIKYGMVEIWFVDFGNFESVQRDHIRALHSDWLVLPVQQHVCQIYAVELADESHQQNAVEHMSLFCNTMKTAEIISIEPLVAEFYDDNGELCYKDIIEKNIISYRK